MKKMTSKQNCTYKNVLLWWKQVDKRHEDGNAFINTSKLTRDMKMIMPSSTQWELHLSLIHCN